MSDTGTGPDSHILVAHGTVAEIDTRASAGAGDQLTLAPGAGSVGLATDAARKPVSLTLLNRAANRRESATVSTTTYHGGADSISFASSARGLVIRHHGPATTLTIKLAVAGGGSVPSVFQSTKVHVPANTTASIPRIHWGSLGTSPVRLRVGNRTRVIQNRLRRLSRLSITSLRSTRPVAHSVSLALHLAPHRLPPATQISFQWVVRRGTSVIATHTMLAGRRSRSARYTLTTPQGGSYRVTATATPVRTSGIAEQAARPAVRTLAFAG